MTKACARDPSYHSRAAVDQISFVTARERIGPLAPHGGTSRAKLYLRPWRPGLAAGAPCAVGVGPWAVGKPTQGSPARVVASQTVSSHRKVTVVRGRLTPLVSG